MEHNKLVGCIRAYIRNAIAATGMSNDDFRSAFGNLSHNTLRLWLNGRYLPTLNNLLRIEALSGVSLDGSGIRIHSALVCMQEILAAAQPKWISVEERLPEPNTTVLLIAHGWEPQLVYIGKLEKVESEKSWLTGLVSKASEWTVYGFSYLKEPIVTHWMPLPSMPQSPKE